jgi:hypothetical protein
LMRARWVLKSSEGYNASSWLSKIEDNSMKTETVIGPTVWKLRKLGLIECKRSFPISTWQLIEKGA